MIRSSASFLLGTCLLASGASAAITSGLVGYFDFETGMTNKAGTVGSDYAGPFENGTNNMAAAGTPNSYGASTGVAGGRSGNGLSLTVLSSTVFPTDTTRVNIPIGFGATGDLGSTFTVSAWYNFTTPPAANGTNRYFILEGTNSFDASYSLQNLTGVGTAGVFDGQTFIAGVSDSTAYNSPDAGSAGWHHVLLSYTTSGANTTVRTYIDGALTTTSGTRATVDITDVGFNIGAARNTTNNRGFDGKIDEVALWNRTLTPDEILAVYNLGLTGQAIPEPSAALLGGLGLLALLRRRRSN